MQGITFGLVFLLIIMIGWAMFAASLNKPQKDNQYKNK